MPSSLAASRPATSASDLPLGSAPSRALAIAVTARCTAGPCRVASTCRVGSSFSERWRVTSSCAGRNACPTATLRSCHCPLAVRWVLARSLLVRA